MAEDDFLFASVSARFGILLVSSAASPCVVQAPSGNGSL
jgi:hypothetical protein